LGQVTVPATFRDESNYRTETLVFEVVDFSGSFHVILGWPCYVKFMAITSYAYLKLQILGPTGVITVEAKAQRALDCEQNSLVLAAAVELREFSPQEPTKPLSLVMLPMSGIFKMDEDAKAARIDAGDLAKTVQIGACLDPK
jgi:hypothetical protein